MDKISNILPPSARVRAADVADAQPARPGAPNFGRTEGKNSLGDRVTLSKIAQELRDKGGEDQAEVETAKTYKNTPENSKKQVIAKMSESFFNPKTEIRDSDLTSSQQVLRSVEDGDDLGKLASRN